jgi:DeoR/GlpR family transcriptional regulator of sugar metabolism
MRKDNAAARLERILERLAGGGEVSVADLAGRLGVTAMTIRRDLDRLAREGRITRTHGGALLAAPSVVAFKFQERRRAHLAEKKAVALAAVGLVKPGMTVSLDTGTTTLEVARALCGIARLRVLTNSLAIASALLAHEGLELVLLGGTVSQSSPDLFGPLTLANLAAFRADIAFLGLDAADERGLYTDSQQAAQVSRAIMAGAERVVVVADSSKFGRHAFVRIAGWEAVDRLIVDRGLPPGVRARVGKSVASLTLAPVAKEGMS